MILSINTCNKILEMSGASISRNTAKRRERIYTPSDCYNPKDPSICSTEEWITAFNEAFKGGESDLTDEEAFDVANKAIGYEPGLTFKVKEKKR